MVVLSSASMAMGRDGIVPGMVRCRGMVGFGLETVIAETEACAIGMGVADCSSMRMRPS
jgi:hypothetical protein